MIVRTLYVSIIASGQHYQESAALAASTYVPNLPLPGKVTVFLPEGENPTELLKIHSQKYGFSIKFFPFCPVKAENLTSQLKCQGFWNVVSEISADDLLLLADADTFCLKPLIFSAETEPAILQGHIGFVRDIHDLHSHNPKDPWFLPQNERATYVNSGVILTSRRALDIFAVCLDLSKQPQFLRPRCQDQGIINFALGKHFKDRLLLLDKIYNGMHAYRCAATVIGHCAGGSGRFSPERRANHTKFCAAILNNGHAYQTRIETSGKS